MEESAKYLVHATISADGVVERSDVVGAIYGQTEGLLGSELDLRSLQESSKVGRIDVTIESEGGVSTGELTIASGLDKAETAILAAALETIERIGPCSASISIEGIEDVRAAKRRDVVERAKELVATIFDEGLIDSTELIEEVRESIRVERITELNGLPAGPRVTDSDAVILVEGRADVLNLLKYGIKNAVAVEGTNIPESIPRLTENRTVTAFFDDDRGGELILRELVQVSDIDYVALTPNGRSVENLSRREVHAALRDKQPVELILAAQTDSSVPDDRPESDSPSDVINTRPLPSESSSPSSEASGLTVEGQLTPESADSLAGHVAALRENGTSTVRLLNDTFELLEEAPATDAFDVTRDATEVPAAIVLDGELTQRLLDVAAQRGVQQVIARSEGEFTKKPTDLRIRLFGEFRGSES